MSSYICSTKKKKSRSAERRPSLIPFYTITSSLLNMEPTEHEDVHLQLHLAAGTFSSILTENGINHAFIGGFALQTYGHSRSTKDIDVVIDVKDVEARVRVVQLVIDQDQRFSINKFRKLVFTPVDPPTPPVEVPVFPVRSLGLPHHLPV